MKRLGRLAGFLDHGRSSKATNAFLPSYPPAFISVLPVEILAYVFELGIPMSHEWNTARYPLIIASVCHIWRNVALHITPLIWSSIVLSISHPLEFPLLYIKRSRVSPLKLFFVAIDIDSSIASVLQIERERNQSLLLQMVDVFQQYIHRWEVLKFICSQQEFSVVMGSLNHARIPKLHTFTVDCIDNYFRPLPSIFEADGVPNLASVALHRIPKLHLQPSLSSITKLELRTSGYSMSYSDMSSFLQSFRRLRQLTFVLSGPSIVEDDQILLPDLRVLDFGSSLGCLQAFSLQTPSLRTFKFSASRTCARVKTLPELLMSSRYPRPSVEKFVISGPLRIPNGVKDVLQAFPNIKHLVLHDPGMEGLVKFLRSTFQEGHSCQPLETLTISPWSNEHFEKWLDGIGNGDRVDGWKPLERIQLVVDDDSPMSVGLHDAFKTLAKNIEILPSHIDPADISIVVEDLGDKGSFLY